MVEKRAHIQDILIGKQAWLASCIRAVVFFLWCLALFSCPSGVSAIEISNTPLESAVVSPPVNVMWVLDNSGSMDWEFMTPEEEGIFQDCLYLFPVSAYQPGPDHRYTDGASLNAAQRRMWRSQWAGYNRLYFDPSKTYLPWPSTESHAFDQADLNRPWSNPMLTGKGHPRIDMSATFVSIQSDGGEIRICNSHYFTHDDVNSNGVHDPDEGIYLVTWVDDDKDRIIDIGAGRGQDRRRYYRFLDDGDGKVEDNELVPLSAKADKDRVRPAIVNAHGRFIRFQTDQEALQNFTNWFTYYRRRLYTLKAVTAHTIRNLSQVNVGLCAVNEGPQMGVLPVGVRTGDVSQDSTLSLLDALYAMPCGGHTPLRRTLDRVGRYFQRQGRSGINPSFNPSASGGSCRRHMAVVVSDGFWNGEFAGVGNADGNKGPPYGDPHANTLADVAANYYDNDLAPEIEDAVPVSGCADSNHQHMVTMALTFNLNGSIAISDMDNNGVPDRPNYADSPCLPRDALPHLAWPLPEAVLGHETGNGQTSGSAELLDDLFHATLNGRGRWYAMDEAQVLQRDLQASTPQILQKTVSGAVTLNDHRLRESSVLYHTSYDSAQWNGEVTAWGLDGDGASFGRMLWRASDHFLPAEMHAAQRCVITCDGSDRPNPGVPFRYDSLGIALQAALVQGDTPHTDHQQTATDLIAYLRGTPISHYRHRTSLLGDIVHATPVVVGDTLFVGANDGMLHALDAQSGKERFAYVPTQLFGHLKALSDPGYNSHHRFYVDGPLWAGEVALEGYRRRTYLVGALGKGGHGYFCLLAGDRSRSYSNNAYGAYAWAFHVDQLGTPADENRALRVVRWEYPGSDVARDGIDNNGDSRVDEPGEIDPDIGYAFGQGYAVNANSADQTQRAVVIFGNGYNSQRQRAMLYVLDAHSGEILRKIDTGAAMDNGLSSPALIDVNRDQRVDYAYAGDLNGNLWKFDLRAEDPNLWGIAYGEDRNGDNVIDAAAGDRPQPLFQTRGQPITARPDVMAMTTACNPQTGGYMVVFGTGRYLAPGDLGDTRQQSIYGIWDYGDDSDDEEHLGFILDRASGYLSSGLRLVPQTVTAETAMDGALLREISQAPVVYATQEDRNDARQTDDPVEHAGWYLDFPVVPDPLSHPGERVVGRVILRSGKAVVTSLVPEQTLCRSGGSSWIYLLNACSGSQSEGSADNFQAAKQYAGRILAPPAIVKDPTNPHLDRMVLPDQFGGIVMESVVGELWGQAYWWQNME